MPVRDPVHLHDPALSGERPVAVPGVVAAAEGEQRALHRRNLGDNVVHVIGGAQQAEAAAVTVPVTIQVKEHGDDLAGKVGVDGAVVGSTVAAHGYHGRQIGQVE